MARREFAASRERRRSAFRLLLGIGLPRKSFTPSLFEALADPDPWIAGLASRLCLQSGTKREKPEAAARLIELLKVPDPVLIAEIEDCLISHYDIAASSIEETVARGSSAGEPDTPWWLKDKTLSILLRVRRRAAQMGTKRRR